MDFDSDDDCDPDTYSDYNEGVGFDPEFFFFNGDEEEEEEEEKEEQDIWEKFKGPFEVGRACPDYSITDSTRAKIQVPESIPYDQQSLLLAGDSKADFQGKKRVSFDCEPGGDSITDSVKPKIQGAESILYDQHRVLLAGDFKAKEKTKTPRRRRRRP